MKDNLREQIEEMIDPTSEFRDETVDKILSLIIEREERLIERIEELAYTCYTNETEKGYHEDTELNKAHNVGLDMFQFRLSKLKGELGEK